MVRVPPPVHQPPAVENLLHASLLPTGVASTLGPAQPHDLGPPKGVSKLDGLLEGMSCPSCSRLQQLRCPREPGGFEQVLRNRLSRNCGREQRFLEALRSQGVGVNL